MTLDYPMHIKFVNEVGVDEGGVQRDMYTSYSFLGQLLFVA